MRKLSILAVVTVASALGGVALANGDSAKSTSKSGRVIKLFAPTVQFKLIDLGEHGFSLGDESVFSDNLLTQKDGEMVGVDGGVCTVVRVADAKTGSGTVQCAVTFSLAGGQIATQGLVTLTNGQLTGTQIAAITGGTGLFRGAQGESAVEFLSPSTANVTLSIDR